MPKPARKVPSLTVTVLLPAVQAVVPGMMTVPGPLFVSGPLLAEAMPPAKVSTPVDCGTFRVPPPAFKVATRLAPKETEPAPVKLSVPPPKLRVLFTLVASPSWALVLKARVPAFTATLFTKVAPRPLLVSVKVDAVDLVTPGPARPPTPVKFTVPPCNSKLEPEVRTPVLP